MRRGGGFVPVEFESLGEESPVGSVGARGVQTAADLLPDEVGDLKGARAGQSRAALIHKQEIGIQWPGVLQPRNTVRRDSFALLRHLFFFFIMSYFQQRLLPAQKLDVSKVTALRRNGGNPQDLKYTIACLRFTHCSRTSSNGISCLDWNFLLAFALETGLHAYTVGLMTLPRVRPWTPFFPPSFFLLQRERNKGASRLKYASVGFSRG